MRTRAVGAPMKTRKVVEEALAVAQTALLIPTLAGGLAELGRPVRTQIMPYPLWGGRSSTMPSIGATGDAIHDATRERILQSIAE